MGRLILKVLEVKVVVVCANRVVKINETYHFVDNLGPAVELFD